MHFGYSLRLLGNAPPIYLSMADVVQNAQQEFGDHPPSWTRQSGTSLFHRTRYSRSVQWLRQRVYDRAKFCHSCGAWPVGCLHGARCSQLRCRGDGRVWSRNVAWMGLWQPRRQLLGARFHFPAWLRYLHFHEIKRWVGLPTASLIAFIIGLGGVAGALGVSFFYKASNLAEFQAIQMCAWNGSCRNSFVVAGILLKTPSDND